MDVRSLLTILETEAEPRPALAWLAARDLDLGEDELRGALRRAMLLLATGGDPRRALDPEGRAVASVAAELRSFERAVALRSLLGALEVEAEAFPRLAAALAELGADEESAWRWLACALLAEELGGEND